MNALESAVKMEVEGEMYYAEQAQLNIGNSLSTVFMMLAKDERNHAEILRKKMFSHPYELNENDTFRESMSVFKELKDFGHEFKENPDQLDVYRVSLNNEKKSIDAYKVLLAEAVKDADAESDKSLFEYLIRQEEEHFKIMDELVLLLNRPNEWVESAEFGIREEY